MIRNAWIQYLITLAAGIVLGAAITAAVYSHTHPQPTALAAPAVTTPTVTSVPEITDQCSRLPGVTPPQSVTVTPDAVTVFTVTRDNTVLRSGIWSWPASGPQMDSSTGPPPLDDSITNRGLQMAANHGQPIVYVQYCTGTKWGNTLSTPALGTYSILSGTVFVVYTTTGHPGNPELMNAPSMAMLAAGQLARNHFTEIGHG